MKNAIIVFLSLVALSAYAEDAHVYQTDKYGNIQYHKPSLTITTNGRVIRTDAHGNKLYHKQQYQITGDKIVPVSALGYRQYSKPALVIKGQ